MVATASVACRTVTIDARYRTDGPKESDELLEMAHALGPGHGL